MNALHKQHTQQYNSTKTQRVERVLVYESVSDYGPGLPVKKNPFCPLLIVIILAPCPMTLLLKLLLISIKNVGCTLRIVTWTAA